jgi:hypothetical protein
MSDLQKLNTLFTHVHIYILMDKLNTPYSYARSLMWRFCSFAPSRPAIYFLSSLPPTDVLLLLSIIKKCMQISHSTLSHFLGNRMWQLFGLGWLGKHTLGGLRSEVLTAMNMKAIAFCDVMACSSEDGYQNFGGTCFFRFHIRQSRLYTPPRCWSISIILHAVTCQTTTS